MARVTRYDPNFIGVGKIMTSARMEGMLRARAQAGKAWAVAASPRATGQYADSFGVASTRRGGGAWPDRAAAYLYNTAPHALRVEFHNGDRVLGRAVDVIERAG